MLYIAVVHIDTCIVLGMDRTDVYGASFDVVMGSVVSISYVDRIRIQ